MKEVPQRIEGTEEGALTLRPGSEGAEKWLYRPIKCLDHGFVYLVDYMGNDDAVTEAARVSYGKGTEKISNNKGLIRYLRRHDHTTPSEMVEFKFHCKMPIFVARQWIRHRTASVNEYSGRYSIMSNEFYMPDANFFAKQSTGNKQGRGEELTPEQKARVSELLKEDYERSYAHYEEFISEDFDLARELARVGLSVANYTQWYWKIDLHNLMHFLRLRMDSHAQYEIRVFANAMARIVEDAVPVSFGAFKDYQLNATKLTGPEKEIIATNSWPMDRETVAQIVFERLNNKRETNEFLEKLSELNLLK
ncbi:MAG: FAD-dependent thymidylate synthase [Candidatus Spechtbacterales bacterium]